MNKNLTPFLFTILLFGLHQIGFTQNKVKGKIIDGTTGEPLYGCTVVVKGTTDGAVTDFDGLFEIETTKDYPLTISASYLGYEAKELEVLSSKQEINLKLGDNPVVINVVEIKGQRISDKQKAAPLTVESLDLLAIKQTASTNFYTGLGNLKGVDLTTASLGFAIINTRGFNSTSPVRSLQIIDGVDNQAPGLNFSLGNFLGSSELDVLKVDLIAGASSAFYGPNAFNGVISMETKNPFFQKGLSVSLKKAERNLTELAIRGAGDVKNKAGNAWMAYKLNFFVLRANDWVAENNNAVFNSKSKATNPGGYDKVNTYGDEFNRSFDFSNGSNGTSLNGISSINHLLGIFHRSGYDEKDLVDYNTKNTKANAALHFRTFPTQLEQSPEIIISSSFGSGTTVYQGDNRFSLRDILFLQNKIEYRKKDKFFIRAYSTQEDAGKSFDPYYTAILLQEGRISNEKFQGDYSNYWNKTIKQKIEANGYPKSISYLDSFGNFVIKFDTIAALNWINKYQDSIKLWHQQTLYDSNFNTSQTPYLKPGTPEFQKEFDRITSTKSNKRDLKNGGSQFYDKSALYHIHGEYKLDSKELGTFSVFDEITLGVNYRQYRPNTDGTIFSDTVSRITNSEYGTYIGVEKKIYDKRLKFNATLRMDKNENFDELFSPAVSAVYQPNAKNFFRLSFSSAIRNPTLSDQYLYLNVGRAILIGNLNGVKDLVTIESLIKYVGSRVRSDLDSFNLDPIRPENVKSFELGYRTTLFDKVFIDGSYYFSYYKNFIGYKIGAVPEYDEFNRFTGAQVYRYAANSTNTVTTQGFSVGINYYFKKYYQLGGNYSWNRLNKLEVADPIVPAFNTPEHKYNISISGRDIEIGKLKNFGFNITYKWIQGFLFEGSPQFTGEVPTYSLLDGQVNHKFTNINTTLKVGCSNILNQQSFQTYGGPIIGRMLYATLLYDLQ